MSPGTLAAFAIDCVLATVFAVVVIVLAVEAAQIARDRYRKRRRVPGLPRDGKRLTQPERERLDEIEDGYGPAPTAMRRLR